MSQSDYYRGVEVAETALRGAADRPPAERAAAVHAAMAPWFESTAEAPLRACRRGCSHCCHLPVGVTFGEALRLAAALYGQPELVRRVTTEAAATAALPWPALAGRPCPMLDEGACRVHADRPLPCRALASSDAEACARGLRGTGDVPVDDEAFWRGLGAAAALANSAAPAGTRELRDALRAVVTAEPTRTAEAFAAARPAGPGVAQ